MSKVTLESLDEVRFSLEKLIEIQPDKDNPSYNQGNALFRIGRFEDAIAKYDKPLEIQPDFYEAWYNRGDALFNLGRYEEAIASYDEALKRTPDFHEAWNNQGSVPVSERFF